MPQVSAQQVWKVAPFIGRSSEPSFRATFPLPSTITVVVCFAALLLQCASAGGVMLPVAHVEASRATFYVTRSDVVLFPISYSIPKELIVSKVPEKTAFAVNDSSRSFMYKRYQFGPMQEKEYLLNMGKHRFGDSRRKGGYDCMRHYEQLASGTVPIYDDLENLPLSIMTTLPRKQLLHAKELFALPWSGTEEEDDGPGELPENPRAVEALGALNADLLNYTAEHLTTEHTARYILETLDVRPHSKVLFLPCVAFDNFPSYLTASVFHGLVSLLGDNVIDAPEYDYAYEWPGDDKDNEERIRGQMWGQGFSLGFKLPRRPHINRANISARIQALEFDLIIFGRTSPYEPCCFWYEFAGQGAAAPQYFEDVFGRYPKERVAMLYGDDSGLSDAVIRTHVTRMGGMNKGLGYVFMRELLPFVGEGPEDSLKPVDGELLQPGCWYHEWQDFLSRWHALDSGLFACVSRGECDNSDVEEYLTSYYFDWQSPPADPTILNHFCRNAFVLKAVLLIRLLGPDECSRNGRCTNSCEFGIGTYAKGLLEIDSDRFFREFGITSSEIVFALSLGCKGGQMSLQPAHAQRRKDVAIVAHDPLSETDAGPFAGFWQVLYLLRQGYTVQLVGSDPAMELPPPVRVYFAQGLLTFTYLQDGDCNWLQKADGRPFHYVHFDAHPSGRDLDSVVAAIGCLAGVAQAPEYVSVQLPNSDGQQSKDALSTAIKHLSSAGHGRFKLTRLSRRSLSRGALGAPVANLASDGVAGLKWRTAAEVFTQPLLGAQIHSTALREGTAKPRRGGARRLSA